MLQIIRAEILPNMPVTTTFAHPRRGSSSTFIEAISSVTQSVKEIIWIFYEFIDNQVLRRAYAQRSTKQIRF